MTKTDYELIAGALNATRPELCIEPTIEFAQFEQWRRDCFAMCSVLEVDNKLRGNRQFDRDRFLNMCGVKPL